MIGLMLLVLKEILKEIKTMAKEFYKTAKERQVYTQRMQSLYEDMGNILNRYFEINGEITDEQSELKKFKEKFYLKNLIVNQMYMVN